MIKSLTLSNFRGHETKYNFGPGLNFIRGRNEAGKTSIKEAISFAWMGTDSEGTKSPDHLITVGADVAEVHLETPRSVIKRRKKRGATSEVKLALPNVPDIKLTQTELMQKLTISPEVFMSCWNVGYFMRLKSEQRLKVLGEIAKLDRRDLLMSVLPEGTRIPATVKLVNPRIDADAVAGTRRQIQNKLTAAQAVHARATQNLSTMPSPEHSVVAGLEMALNEVEAAMQDWEFYDKALAKYKADLTRFESAQELGNTLLKAVQEANEHVAHLVVHIDNDSKEAQKHYVAREEASKKGQELSKQIKTASLPVPVKPSAKAGDCPTCGHKVDANHLKKLEDAYSAALMEYNKHEREIATHNEGIKAQLDVQRARYTTANDEYSKVMGRLEQLRKDQKAAQEALDKLKARVQSASEGKGLEKPTAPSLPKSDRTALTQKRDSIRDQLHSFNTARAEREKLLNEVATAEKEAMAYQVDIQALSQIEKALLSLPELETQRTLEVVRIPGVTMSLQDGDLVICNEQGVDYRSLSDGRRMKVDKALCFTLRQAVGPAAPTWVFVDNADLMDDFGEIPQGIQVLVAEVDLDAKAVQIVQM